MPACHNTFFPSCLLRQQGCSWGAFRFQESAGASSVLGRSWSNICDILMACLQRSRGRCLTIVNMKKDIHPKYYEEAKVIRAFSVPNAAI